MTIVKRLQFSVAQRAQGAIQKLVGGVNIEQAVCAHQHLHPAITVLQNKRLYRAGVAQILLVRHAANTVLLLLTTFSHRISDLLYLQQLRNTGWDRH